MFVTVRGFQLIVITLAIVLIIPLFYSPVDAVFYQTRNQFINAGGLRICTSSKFNSIDRCGGDGTGSCKNVDVNFKDGVRTVVLFYCNGRNADFCVYATSTSGTGTGTMWVNPSGSYCE